MTLTHGCFLPLLLMSAGFTAVRDIQAVRLNIQRRPQTPFVLTFCGNIRSSSHSQPDVHPVNILSATKMSSGRSEDQGCKAEIMLKSPKDLETRQLCEVFLVKTKVKEVW